MPISHVLAVVPVTDIEASRRWYTALFDRPEDNNPMPSLVEWQVLPGAWVQVFADETAAGQAYLNLAVDDLDQHVDDLRRRGLHPGEISAADKGVRLSRLSDPDGNTIGLIGGFRVVY